jgi:hypothetical protein
MLIGRIHEWLGDDVLHAVEARANDLLQSGQSGLRDRSSASQHCPNAAHADIVNKIVYLRQNHHFGPVKIQMYLKRYHDITNTSSAIHNILVRLGLNRLPASQR